MISWHLVEFLPKAVAEMHYLRCFGFYWLTTLHAFLMAKLTMRALISSPFYLSNLITDYRQIRRVLVKYEI